MNGKNLRNGGRNAKRSTPRNSRNTQRPDKAALDGIYTQMRAAIARRSNYQSQYDEAWSKVKRYGCDKDATLTHLSKCIGNETHTLNMLISRLCQYRASHRAMNLAYSFLGGEIERCSRIAESKSRGIARVRRGVSELVDSHGNRHTDTTHLERYVEQKVAQRDKLVKWREYVGRYRV